MLFIILSTVEWMKALNAESEEKGKAARALHALGMAKSYHRICIIIFPGLETRVRDPVWEVQRPSKEKYRTVDCGAAW